MILGSFYLYSLGAPMPSAKSMLVVIFSGVACLFAQISPSTANRNKTAPKSVSALKPDKPTESGEAAAKVQSDLKQRITWVEKTNEDFKQRGMPDRLSLYGVDQDSLLIELNDRAIPSASQLAERTRWIINQGYGSILARNIAFAEVKYEWLEGFFRFAQISRLMTTPPPD